MAEALDCHIHPVTRRHGLERHNRSGQDDLSGQKGYPVGTKRVGKPGNCIFRSALNGRTKPLRKRLTILCDDSPER